ncbi:MAG: hypothetical protein ACJ8AY_15580 [Gemmatimonadales bacterium]
MRRSVYAILGVPAVLLLVGCAHLGLLRPNRLKQLNTRVVNLVKRDGSG